MGTINYKTNKYVTIGLNTNYLYEDTEDIQEEEIYETELFIYEETKAIIEKYNFDYFVVNIVDGYYDGFCINFDFKKDYISSYEERTLIEKEITQLKKLLFELVDYELNVCFPWWVTKWLNNKESKQEIQKAIKEIRKDAKAFEIWN